MFLVTWSECNLFCLETNPEHICQELDETSDHWAVEESFGDADRLYGSLSNNLNVRLLNISKPIKSNHILFGGHTAEREKS